MHKYTHYKSKPYYRALEFMPTLHAILVEQNRGNPNHVSEQEVTSAENCIQFGFHAVYKPLSGILMASTTYNYTATNLARVFQEEVFTDEFELER